MITSLSCVTSSIHSKLVMNPFYFLSVLNLSTFLIRCFIILLREFSKFEWSRIESLHEFWQRISVPVVLPHFISPSHLTRVLPQWFLFYVIPRYFTVIRLLYSILIHCSVFTSVVFHLRAFLTILIEMSTGLSPIPLLPCSSTSTVLTVSDLVFFSSFLCTMTSSSSSRSFSLALQLCRIPVFSFSLFIESSSVSVILCFVFCLPYPLFSGYWPSVFLLLSIFCLFHLITFIFGYWLFLFSNCFNLRLFHHFSIFSFFWLSFFPLCFFLHFTYFLFLCFRFSFFLLLCLVFCILFTSLLFFSFTSSVFVSVSFSVSTLFSLFSSASLFFVSSVLISLLDPIIVGLFDPFSFASSACCFLFSLFS